MSAYYVHHYFFKIIFCVLFLTNHFIGMTSMELERKDKFPEYDKGIQNYEIAQNFHANFKCVQEDSYITALSLYLVAAKYFQQAHANGYSESLEKLSECIAKADPAFWGLLKFKLDEENSTTLNILKAYLEKNNSTQLPSLHLHLPEERRRRETSANSSPKSLRSADSSARTTPHSPESAQSSDDELGARIKERFNSKLSLRRKASSLRQASPPKEEPASSSKKVLPRTTKVKDLKPLLSTKDEDSKTISHEKQSLRIPIFTIADLNEQQPKTVMTQRFFFHGQELEEIAHKAYMKGKTKKTEIQRREKYKTCVYIACAAAQNYLAAYDAGNEESLEKAKQVLKMVNEPNEWRLAGTPADVRDILWGLWEKIGIRCWNDDKEKGYSSYEHWSFSEPAPQKR